MHILKAVILVTGLALLSGCVIKKGHHNSSYYSSYHPKPPVQSGYYSSQTAPRSGYSSSQTKPNTGYYSSNTPPQKRETYVTHIGGGGYRASAAPTSNHGSGYYSSSK